MSIDLLPFGAFAHQSYAAAQGRGEGQTFTSQPAPMSGLASANQVSIMHCDELLRAAVVPADRCVLTITFG